MIENWEAFRLVQSEITYVAIHIL